MIVITLPIPDRNLSLNGRMHWRSVAKGRRAQHELALARGALALARAGLAAPCYPEGKLAVYIDVERKARGNVWDTAGIIEACKGYCDGLNGVVYTDDAQIRSFAVRWDQRPTGRGLVHLYIRPLSAPRGWPVVEWATEKS